MCVVPSNVISYDPKKSLYYKHCWLTERTVIVNTHIITIIIYYYHYFNQFQSDVLLQRLAELS